MPRGLVPSSGLVMDLRLVVRVRGGYEQLGQLGPLGLNVDEFGCRVLCGV